RRAALVLAVAAAVLLPWTIRNYVHARRFVPLEVDMGSYNLVAAAVGVDHALGGDEAFAIAERLEPGFQSRHAADSISQRERALLGVAVRAILRSPGLFLFGSLRRAAAFWRPLWALAALAAFAALAPGASAGIQAAALLAAAFSLYGVIGLGAGYRLCVEPLLTALAAVGLARLSGLPPPRESGPDPLRLALPAAAAVGAAALACLLLTPLDALAQRPAGKPRCDEPAPFLLAFLDDGDRACSGKWALAGEAGALRARALMCAGMSASAAGDGARAREDLAEAESLDLDADSRFQIALRYQELKDYPSALRVLDGLVRRYPANGDFRGARGLCLYLGGSPRDSEADLEAAIKLTPDSLSAYLTLGAVYSASARYGAAVAVYDRALAAGAARGSADLRRQILGGRESALLKLRGRVN
ncbi:MAG TPA: hypothetical protein VH309_12615, partial [Elusimicrobiota bacterium]|nr:hypothetical protein [Elusimicrobiota bacterium]